MLNIFGTYSSRPATSSDSQSQGALYAAANSTSQCAAGPEVAQESSAPSLGSGKFSSFKEDSPVIACAY